MQVIVIGAGRVGTVIGYLLHKHGFNIMGINNKHFSSAQKAVSLIGAGEVYDDLELVKNLKFADLIIITTPDDIIARKAKYISKLKLKKTVCLMHMSGLYSSQILNPDEQKKINVFSLHPLQAVSCFKEGVKLLPNAVFSLEGNQEGVKIGRMIAEKLNLQYYFINRENKILYHAAAVTASNYLVTLINSSYKMLQSAGIEDDEIKDGILNLVKGTLSNLEKSTPKEALTGPIARNDINTINLHREKLKEKAGEQLRLYDLLGEYTAEMAGKGKLSNLFQEGFSQDNKEE